MILLRPNNVLRTIPILLLPAILTAQDAQVRSNSNGLWLGLHGGTMLVNAPGIETEPGRSVGVIIGRSITRRFSLFAGANYSRFRVTRDRQASNTEEFELYLDRNAQVTALSPSFANTATARQFEVPGTPARTLGYAMGYTEGENSAWHLDAGTQYTFTRPQSALVPYVSAGLSIRRVANRRDYTERTSNMTFTPGAGVQYYVRNDLALDLNAMTSIGNSIGDWSGQAYNYISTTSRISLGFRLYESPKRK
jgi:hypothetical protein